MPEIALPHRWKPRDYQMPLWRYLEGGGKRAINIWHRRAGKDDVCLHWAAVAAFERPATYWHMLPGYAQGRKAVWTAVNPHTGRRRIDEAFPREIRASTNEQEMFIRFKSGSTWQVVGSDRYDSTVGSPPAGVTFSEWALANPAAWGYLAPILVENNGWALFITTARGRNHAKSMLDMARKTPDWFAQVLNIDDTRAITREAVEAQRIEYHGIFGEEDGDALIEQEYFCSFDVAVLGTYYGKIIGDLEKNGRLGRVDYDPALEVHTAWDLGITDTMSIWFFQVAGSEIRVIDYYQGHGQPLSFYTKALDARGYRYGIDWVPHDAKVKELGTGRTRVETLISLDRNPRLIPNHKVIDGINAVRQILPRCWIDEKSCRVGIEALREYKKEYDEARRVFRDTPCHDWASHPADAFRYLAMAFKEAEPAEEGPPKPRFLQDATLEDLWDHQTGRRSNGRI